MSFEFIFYCRSEQFFKGFIVGLREPVSLETLPEFW